VVKVVVSLSRQGSGIRPQRVMGIFGLTLFLFPLLLSLSYRKEILSNTFLILKIWCEYRTTFLILIMYDVYDIYRRKVLIFFFFLPIRIKFVIVSPLGQI
jgi:hypothetical protein